MRHIIQIALLALIGHLLILGLVLFVAGKPVALNIMDWEPMGRFVYLIGQGFFILLGWMSLNS